ncbi:copper homeostasis protein CutC [Streptomyces sp. NPDC047072]|uniref:copper homeostasis protein CutC n=1 Tax=Streptomyces sp. NPDC047072 TaxID=3154809 RepID=UPI0033DF06C7
MSERAVLEVIALGVEDAVAAQAGGADRLELVTDMAADGLTPAVATVAGIRAAVDISLRVMLRLTAGFAVGDVERLVRVAGEMREAGAEEFVLGFLDAEGGVDVGVVERVVGELDGCRWTFHRAIDHASDRDALRKQLADLPGLDTYLTAGSATGVDEGLPVLLREAARQGEPGYEQRLLVGGGLRLDHVERLRAAGIDGFHIGGAARPDGWTAPVSADAVRTWRRALDRPFFQGRGELRDQPPHSRTHN